jgi:hypothetical protein
MVLAVGNSSWTGDAPRKWGDVVFVILNEAFVIGSVCHPERSEGSLHLGRRKVHGSFTSFRMTRAILYKHEPQLIQLHASTCPMSSLPALLAGPRDVLP